MKVFFTSTSADDYAVNDRVAYKFAQDEWYVGTVTKAASKITILFDDGETFTVGISMKLKKVNYSLKKKTHLTNDEVAEIETTAVTSPAPKSSRRGNPASLLQDVTTKEALVLALMQLEVAESEETNGGLEYTIRNDTLYLMRKAVDDQGHRSMVKLSANLADLDQTAVVLRKDLEKFNPTGFADAAKLAKSFIRQDASYSDVIREFEQLDDLCYYFARQHA